MTPAPCPTDYGRVRPGDFGVVRTPGILPALIRWVTQSTVNHAFVYIGDGKIVEAEPGGAIISLADKYGGSTIWSTGRLTVADDEGDVTDADISSAERAVLIAEAIDCVGVPYGWLDIVCIGLAQRRLGRLIGLRSAIARRVSNMHRLICSQLVDECYLAAGLHLFADGRPDGLVSPGDLLNLIRITEGTPANA